MSPHLLKCHIVGNHMSCYCNYQVVAKEPDYMPSFHGGFYVDRLNAKDLMLEQRKEKEVNVSHQNTLVDTGLDKQPF